ncbi:Gpi16 subunit, GPI transamidase component [Wallemia mellicola]|nr:Gpi16 subunit, GPI transamidase component [Wallemia mellicola]
MISWLFLSFIFGYVASTDSFNEYLTTNPLQDGRVDVGFNFTITDSEISPHTNLFPLPLVNLLRSPEIDIDELHLSLSAGIWDYSKWHYPHFPQLGSSGIELWVSHNSDSTPTKWSRLVHTLSGMFCASFSTSDNAHQVELKDKTWTHAQIASQLPCTENLTPFIALLPCKSSAGLGQLLNPHKLFDADYHSLGLSLYRTDNGARVEIMIEAVMNPTRVNQQRQYSTKGMLDRSVNSPCPLADSSKVYFNLPPTPQQGHDEDLWVVLPEDHDGEVKDGTVDLDVMQSVKPLALSVVYPFQEIFTYPKSITNPPLLIRRDQIAGPIEETMLVRTVVENTEDNDRQVSYFHSIPWQIEPWLHTFTINGGLNDTSYKHSLGEAKKDPYKLQVNATIPAHSQLTIECLYQRQFLQYADYAPDIHRGVDIPPGVLLFNRDDETRFQYTTPLLIDLATPDFSMPYNVIIITSTVIALFFGSVYNILVKEFQLIPRKKEKAKTD